MEGFVGSQTTLIVENTTAQDVQVYLTLGAVAGCVTNVQNVSFITNELIHCQGSVHARSEKSR